MTTSSARPTTPEGTHLPLTSGSFKNAGAFAKAVSEILVPQPATRWTRRRDVVPRVVEHTYSMAPTTPASSS
jgi:hypothetical protein